MPPGGCCTEGVPAPTAPACCLTLQVVQPGPPRARTQWPRGTEAPGCSWWNPAGMLPKPTLGRGVNGSAPPKPSLGSTAAGRAVPKRGWSHGRVPPQSSCPTPEGWGRGKVATSHLWVRVAAVVIAGHDFPMFCCNSNQM